MRSIGTQTDPTWKTFLCGLLQGIWLPLKEGVLLVYNKWIIGPFTGLYIADQITKFPSWITLKVKNEVEKVEGSLYMRWSEQDQSIKKYLINCSVPEFETCLSDEKNSTGSNEDYKVNFLTFISFVAHNNLPPLALKMLSYGFEVQDALPDYTAKGLRYLTNSSFVPQNNFPHYAEESIKYLTSFVINKNSGFHGKIAQVQEQFEKNNYLPMLMFVRSGCEYSNSMVQVIRDVAMFLDSKVGLRENFLERFNSCPDYNDPEEFRSYVYVMTKLAALTINEDYEQTLDALNYLEELTADYKGDKTYTDGLRTEIKYQKLRCMFHYKAGSYQTAAYYQKIAVETGALQKGSGQDDIRYWEMQRLHDIALRKKYFIECAETRQCDKKYIETKQDKLLGSFNDTLTALDKIADKGEKNEPDINHDRNVIKENIIKIYIDRAEILRNSTFLQLSYNEAKNFFQFGDISLHVSEELNIISTLARIIYVEAKLKKNELSQDVYNWVASYLNENREVLAKNVTNNVDMAINLYKVVKELNNVIHPSLLITKKVDYYLIQLKSMQQEEITASEIKPNGDILQEGV